MNLGGLMLIQTQNNYGIKQSTHTQTVQNAKAFLAKTNPFFTGKHAFMEEDPEAKVVQAKSDRLGHAEFTKEKKVTNFASRAEDQIVKFVITDKNSIKLKTNTNKSRIISEIKLKRGTKPTDIQVGWQDNKGGFALKLWDRETKTSYVLFRNPHEPAIVDNSRFTAAVRPSSPTKTNALAFLGTKAVDKKNTQLDKKIEDAIVIGMFGGFGTRLLGVSHPNTKPTTKLGANSFEVNMLRNCSNAGFKNFGASIYFGPEVVKDDIFGAQTKGVLPSDFQISYAQQDADTGNLGTAGAVRHTVEHLLSDRVGEKINNQSPNKARAILEEEVGTTTARMIWDKMDIKERNYGEQLKEIVTEHPHLRELIFDKKIDEVPFISIISGDHVTDINMKEFARTHVDSGADFTLALREVDDSEKFVGLKSPYGHASVDSDGKIENFNEKPYWKQEDVPESKKGVGVYSDKFKWLNTGVYMVTPKIIKMIPSEYRIKQIKEQNNMSAKDEGCDFGKHIIPEAVAENPLQAHCLPKAEHWADVGNNVALQGEIRYIVDNIKQNEGTSGLVPAQEFVTSENSAIATSAAIENVKAKNPEARLFVADNANVGDITIDDTVYVGPGAQVPNGSYKNVWIDKSDKPLYESLSLVG